MKVQFTFNGRRYFAPSAEEALAFVRFWGDGNPNMFPLNNKFNVTHIELGPSYAQLMHVDMGGKVEYEKRKVIDLND